MIGAVIDVAKAVGIWIDGMVPADDCALALFAIPAMARLAMGTAFTNWRREATSLLSSLSAFFMAIPRKRSGGVEPP